MMVNVILSEWPLVVLNLQGPQFGQTHVDGKTFIFATIFSKEWVIQRAKSGFSFQSVPTKMLCFFFPKTLAKGRRTAAMC